MATEEIAGVAMSAAQKGMEISAELIKMFAQAVPNIIGGALDITRGFENKAAAKNGVGSVSRKELFEEAVNAKCGILSNNNFLKQDAEKIVLKAKQYGIPLSVSGDEKKTVTYLERDKDALNQIFEEVMKERIKEAPQSVKSFSISEGGIGAMKAEFDKNGIECAFMRSGDGKIHCIYPADKTEQVAVIKEDYKQMLAEVMEHFTVKADVPESETQIEIRQQIDELREQYDNDIGGAMFEENEELREQLLSEIKENYEPQIEQLEKEYEKEKIDNFNNSFDKKVVVSDGEKSVSFTADSYITKHKVMRILRDELGYSPAKADLAANKLCDELRLNKEIYLSAPTQIDNLDLLKTNIRYDSDDITLRDFSYSAVNFKDGENTHIIISNGEHTAALTPAKMTESDMKKICVDNLGMTEQQSELAVKKALKIDTQINSRQRETSFHIDGKPQTAEIDRISKNIFTVKVGEKALDYELNDINAVDKISADFGIPTANAKNIVDKAGRQSVLQNNINKNLKKVKKKTENAAQAVKEKVAKGARK